MIGQGKGDLNGLGAGCVQLWICSAEPPGEHRYENRNNYKKGDYERLSAVKCCSGLQRTPFPV